MSESVPEAVAEVRSGGDMEPVVIRDPFRDDLLQREEEISKQDRIIEELSEKLKIAKAKREGLITDLRQAIRSHQPSLPFDRPAGSDDWRAVPLAQALNGHVTDKVLEKLAEAELRTVGELADYTARCRLTDIAGIGQAKAEVIEKALEEFWAERNVARETKDEPAEPAASEPDGATLAQIDGGE